MSRTKKAVIVAAVMIVAGIITIISAFVANGFTLPNERIDIKTMKSDKIQYEKKTEYIKDKFRSIDVESASDIDVFVKKAEGDADYVEYYDSKDLIHHVDVTDGTLKITADDNRHNSINFAFGLNADEWPSVTVYLAGTEYDDMKIVTSSGDVDMEYYLEMKNIDIETSSGDTIVKGANASSVKAFANSGNITLDSVSAKNLTLIASSGDVEIKDTVVSDKTEIETSSGDIASSNLKTKDIICSASSGDVTLSESDAVGFDIETSSGDVSVEIASKNKFYYMTKTNSGDVDVPDSYTDAEGSCRITTGSGDIDVTAEN